MLATYGVDVMDPRVSLRRINVLLHRLPPGSTPARDEPSAWSTEAHLLAALVDAVQALTYVTLRAHGGSPSKPRPLPRPGGTTAQRQARTPWKDLGRMLTGQDGMVSNGR